jgi:membrane protease YdiL (CAAX protease family)
MPDPRLKSILKKVFWGPNGIRAGWRLLIFLPLTYVLSEGISAGLDPIPPIANILSGRVRGVLTAPSSLVILVRWALALFLSAVFMSKVERRSFATYGLPPASAFGKLFLQGVAWGLVTQSVVVAAIYALGGFTFGTLALSGFAAIKYGVLWALAYLLVALVQQFSYRGYAQFTLTTGMGFWPSALILSALFGASHLHNLGEDWVGILSAFIFALFCCFTLRRTGNLWFAVGLHAAWDFAEQFLYSVPNSGWRSIGTLLNSAVHGARWLTGGAVGPEASVFTFLCWGLSFLVFDKLYPLKNDSLAHS